MIDQILPSLISMKNLSDQSDQELNDIGIGDIEIDVYVST